MQLDHREIQVKSIQLHFCSQLEVHLTWFLRVHNMTLFHVNKAQFSLTLFIPVNAQYFSKSDAVSQARCPDNEEHAVQLQKEKKNPWGFQYTSSN